MCAIKRRLEGWKPYRVAREIKWVLEKSLNPDPPEPGMSVVSLKPEARSQGNVLLSYIIDPFLVSDERSVSNAHWHDWESLQMARTFLGLNFSVDVISYLNQRFQPEKDYRFIVDARDNLERLTPALGRDCIKILHIDTAHLLYNNAAEARRLLELQQRRGITLLPRRWVRPNRGIEYADCATIQGNEFAVGTFRYAKKPIYRVGVCIPNQFPWPEHKDFNRCRKSYMWFGSGGMVHKGLDLVLEAFAKMPDYSLTVCGPVQVEQDFVAAYRTELFDTPNIHTVGWVDVDSPQFLEICNSCLGLVYPSCSEGGGGGVILCMHAGLIPVVSYESTVDISGEYGVLLKNSTIEQITNAVSELSNRPAADLERMAHSAWEFARKNHTRENFSREYKRVIEKILVDKCASY